jgi:hypothetical protein
MILFGNNFFQRPFIEMFCFSSQVDIVEHGLEYRQSPSLDCSEEG